MACLKLTYRSENPFLKVVKGSFDADEKSSAGRYRFGFNGQEREAELNPSITSAEYWMYDGRLGRRWNVDPKPNLSISPYATFANNPVLYTDPYGDTSWVVTPGQPSVFDTEVSSPEEVLKKYGENSTFVGNTVFEGNEMGTERPFRLYPDGSWEYTNSDKGIGLSIDKLFPKDGYVRNLNWMGIADASLGVIGGGFEIAVGLGGEVFTGGFSTFLVIDGGHRIFTNTLRLGGYLSNENELADAAPTNLGAYYGKIVDGINGTPINKVGTMQASFGFANDLLLIVTPATSNAGAWNALQQSRRLRDVVGLGSTYYGGIMGLYNHGKAIKNSDGK